ncbi:hypothetical protein ACEWY4_000712 [Coilia grayii]|uniref:Breast carcinoma-amplified sequence 1 n=1 Tax=Coilia grayii TaxID=363190 RepID=A0ABD1KXF7_9TELE
MGNEVSSQKKNAQKDKVQNGDLNGHAVNVSSDDLTETVTSEVTVKQTTESSTADDTTTTTPSPETTSGSQNDGDVQEHPREQPTDTKAAEPANNAACVRHHEEESKSPEENKSNFFNKLFNKKSTTKQVEVEEETQPKQMADQVDAEEVTEDLKSEPVVVKDSTEPEQTETESLHPSPTVTEQNQAEEHPVMNFFKTLVTPTKAPNKAAASSDVPKDQSQEATAATTASANVQEVDVAKAKTAPPPPPEPPKMEGKAEAAVKKEEVQEAPKDAGAKPKQAKESPFSKLFRSKEEAAPAPVEVQTDDASKAATLEASAKPEPGPSAVKEEEKKAEKKASPFASFFNKPKAPEPSKETPAVAASPEPPQGTKAKEEVKTAPPTAPPAPPVEKSVESAENPSPTVPRREKRNSIQLFFKNLVPN